MKLAHLATTAGARLAHFDLAGRFSTKAELAMDEPRNAPRTLAPAFKPGTRPILREQQKPIALVCDDDSLSVDMIAHHLSKAGYDVVKAADGGIALAMLEKQIPDVVVLSIMIPVIDGLEVLKRIREKPIWRNIPVVMLTYRHSEEDVVGALQEGASDYMTKPFMIGELVERVNRLLTPYEHPLESLLQALEA